MDGHATGLLGLQAVCSRLSDPGSRCQGLELACLLQALCKQLLTAATDTNLVLFASADQARTAIASSAAAAAARELSVGSPELSAAVSGPSPGLPTSAASWHPAAPEAGVTQAATPGSTSNTAALPAGRATAVASRRGQSGSGALAAGTTADAPPKQQPAATVAGTLEQQCPAAATPTHGLAGLVTDGIALLVEHLEHFHYKAKGVALDGLLALSSVGLGPDRRLDPGGAALMSASSSGSAGSGGPAASSAALLAAAAAAGGGGGGASVDERGGGLAGASTDPAEVADAVAALGGLGLGDWLALRIVGAGALPRLLELLTHRTGVNFVQHRHVASQVVHNLSRRRCVAVRAALARWRPLPGLISGLDVVLEDNPDIAARLLLALGDLLPTTSHQIAGVLHKLVAKHRAAQQPAARESSARRTLESTQPQEEQQNAAAEGQHGGEPEAAAPTTIDDPTHLGLAPDVDVPLETLLLRVTGYYMRLSFNAVFAPVALPQLPPFRPPASEADKRENDKAYARFKLEDYRRRRKESGQLDCCVAAMLAAAPMPSALFESMSYSYQRALAVLAGPPPGSALTATTSGGLWRAQDLLPYALAVLQSLGGGADTGDGCGGSGVLPTAAAAGGGGLLTDLLSGMQMGSALLGGALAGPEGTLTWSGLYNGTTSAIASALDATWGLTHPRQAAFGGFGPAGAAAVLDGCQGPSLPGAPYGDRPVSEALLDQYGTVITAILQRAIQAADGLPAASAASAAALANGGAVGLLRQAAAEAPPLVVLRAIGSTLASITRVQVAKKIAACDDNLVRLAASLSPHTGSSGAAQAQARCALGLANLWSCLHVAAAASRPQRELPRLQSAGAQPKAGSGGEAVARAADLHAAPATTEGQVGNPKLPTRRSSRIKRLRDGGGLEALAAGQPATAGCEPAAASVSERLGEAEAQPQGQSSDPSGQPLGGERPTGIASAQLGRSHSGPQPAPEARSLRHQPQREQALLPAMVDLLTARFAEARVMFEAPAEVQAGGDGGGPSAAAASAPWQADRCRQAGEVQALLLQATALLLPGLDAAAARRLVDSGAALCAARVVRAALTVPAVAAAANVGPLGFGAAAAQPPAPPQQLADLESVAAGFGEPQNGLSGAQALGLLVELLRAASAGGGSGFTAAALHNPEVMAALGGALLLAQRGPAVARATAFAPGGAPPGSSANAPASGRSRDREDDHLASEPSASCWDLLHRLASGSRHSAGHDLLLQLLPPLLALTHGPSARCAAARARLLPVLTSVAGRWSHSRTQRRRLLVQALALWGPALQPLLMTLPPEPSPSPLQPAVPVGTTKIAVPRKALAAGTSGCRTQSQSTLPYPSIGRRGSSTAGGGGAARTPTTAVPVLPAGVASTAQRTPQGGSSAAALLSPHGHGATSFGALQPGRALAAPSGVDAAASRTRRGVSRLAPVASPQPAPQPRSAGEKPLNAPVPVPPGVSRQPATDQCAVGQEGLPVVVAAVELAGLLVERLGDGEVVRHLHATGWLRAITCGAQRGDLALRGVCNTTLRAIARSLKPAAAACGPQTPSAHPAPVPPSSLPLAVRLMASGLAADPRTCDLLLSFEPDLASLLQPPVPAGAGGLPSGRVVTFRGAAEGDTAPEAQPAPRRSSRRRAAAAAAAAIAAAAATPPPGRSRKPSSAQAAKRPTRPGAVGRPTVAAAATDKGGARLLPDAAEVPTAPTSPHGKRRRLNQDEGRAEDNARVWAAASEQSGAVADAQLHGDDTCADAPLPVNDSPSGSAPLHLQLSVREAGLAVAVRRSCMTLEAALAARQHDLAAVRAADQAATAAAAAAATMAVAATVTESASGAALNRSRGLVINPPAAAASTAAAAAGPAIRRVSRAALVGDEEFLARTYRSVSKKLNFDEM